MDWKENTKKQIHPWHCSYVGCGFINKKNIVSFVEIRPSTAVEILDFLSKIEDKKEAEKVLKNMILDGFLDEVFKDDEAPEPEVDPDKLGEIEAFHDPSGPEADDDLEDY